MVCLGLCERRSRSLTYSQIYRPLNLKFVAKCVTRFLEQVFRDTFSVPRFLSAPFFKLRLKSIGKIGIPLGKSYLAFFFESMVGVRCKVAARRENGREWIFNVECGAPKDGVFLEQRSPTGETVFSFFRGSHYCKDAPRNTRTPPGEPSPEDSPGL